jgi:hypothetical protein
MKATLVLVAALLGFYGSIAWAADAPAGASAATPAARTVPENAKAANAKAANAKAPRRASPTSSTSQRIPRYVDPSAGQGDAVRCACIARRNQA